MHGDLLFDCREGRTTGSPWHGKGIEQSLIAAIRFAIDNFVQNQNAAACISMTVGSHHDLVGDDCCMTLLLQIFFCDVDAAVAV
jgi:hypothetical protein